MAFVLPKRALRLGDARTREALARVASSWPTNERGDFEFPQGFQLEHVQALMRATPRGFYLLAKTGLIPVTDGQAVTMIFESGLTFEQPRLPVAQVQRAEPGAAKTLMLILLERGYRNPVTPREVPPPTVHTV